MSSWDGWAGRSPAHPLRRRPAEAPTPAWSVRYLVEHGVLSPADVLEAGVAVDDASMSHRAFRVDVGGRARFFVKCADPVGSQGRNLSLETAIYRLAATNETLARVVPRCHRIDEPAGVVVLDAVPDGSLAAIVTPARAPDETTAGLLSAYGQAIADTHSVRPGPLGEPPWLLAALEPTWGDYDWLPRPCAAVLHRLAASPAMRSGFRRARSRWRASALVHSDLRWANALVAGDRVLLVDWELACLGDPAWDLGSALADVVTLLALWGTDDPDPESLAAWARPLLAGYGASGSRARLELAVAMAAVRVVQSLLEIGHVDAEQMAGAEPVLLAWAAELIANERGVAATLAEAA